MLSPEKEDKLRARMAELGIAEESVEERREGRSRAARGRTVVAADISHRGDCERTERKLVSDLRHHARILLQATENGNRIRTGRDRPYRMMNLRPRPTYSTQPMSMTELAFFTRRLPRTSCVRRSDL